MPFFPFCRDHSFLQGARLAPVINRADSVAFQLEQGLEQMKHKTKMEMENKTNTTSVLFNAQSDMTVCRPSSYPSSCVASYQSAFTNAFENFLLKPHFANQCRNGRNSRRYHAEKRGLADTTHTHTHTSLPLSTVLNVLPTLPVECMPTRAAQNRENRFVVTFPYVVFRCLFRAY